MSVFHWEWVTNEYLQNQLALKTWTNVVTLIISSVLKVSITIMLLIDISPYKMYGMLNYNQKLHTMPDPLIMVSWQMLLYYCICIILPLKVIWMESGTQRGAICCKDLSVRSRLVSNTTLKKNNIESKLSHSVFNSYVSYYNACKNLMLYNKRRLI